MISNNINFEQEIDSLHEILNKRKIEQDLNYLTWKQKFILIYGKNRTNLRLYISYSLIFLATIVFIFEYITPRKEEKEKFWNISSKSLIELNNYLRNKKNFDIKNEISYFIPLIEQINEVKPNYINIILNRLEQEIMNYPCAPEYKLDLAFQGILSSELRHGSGEFYTPPFLVKKMISETYKFGDKTLDPCCGSGNFIIEIIRQILNEKVDEGSKVKAIENVYGCDINPFSTYLTKLNLLFLTNLNFANVGQNIFNYDFLLGENSDLPKNFDLIIGNPPWYTLRDIESVDLQNAIKLLSERLEIKPSPKNVLNIEMASLFFYHAKNGFLKVNGTIFFVITKGVITGSHAARFRAFKGFKNIKIWRFNNLIERTFNIDFVCIFAQKSSRNKTLDDFKIPISLFNLDKINQKLNYFDNLDLIEENKEILVPYSIEKKNEKIYVKKFIEEKKFEELLPLKESYYKQLFHKGADLNPRSLIFVKSKVVKNNLVEITP
ncbi:MAG: N-6 DNA methylase, partial [Candidatus Hermodarchaeota archaeon]